MPGRMGGMCGAGRVRPTLVVGGFWSHLHPRPCCRGQVASGAVGGFDPGKATADGKPGDLTVPFPPPQPCAQTAAREGGMAGTNRCWKRQATSSRRVPVAQQGRNSKEAAPAFALWTPPLVFAALDRRACCCCRGCWASSKAAKESHGSFLAFALVQGAQSGLGPSSVEEHRLSTLLTDDTIRRPCTTRVPVTVMVHQSRHGSSLVRIPRGQ